MNKKIIRNIIASFLSAAMLAGCTAVSPKEDPEKKTLDSLTKLGDGIYLMDCYTDYKVDEYLKANITDVTGLDTWLTKNLTHGVPTGDVPDMGCSSFAVNGTSGDHLFGRNYDMDSGDSLIIRTVPANGYSSLRIILDTCATVDEAVNVFNSYDMYSPRHHSYNVFITDKSGRSVIVEWADGTTYVIEDTAVTNFQLCRNRPSLDGDQRYAKIHNRIDDAASMTSEDAMGVLKFVSRDTRWSAVYNLEKFSVDICFNGDYSKTYTHEGIRTSDK